MGTRGAERTSTIDLSTCKTGGGVGAGRIRDKAYTLGPINAKLAGKWRNWVKGGKKPVPCAL